MKVITVINNKGHAGFNLLRLSCSIYHLELIVLVCQQNYFHSNRLKDKLLLDYIENYVKDDEIIFFTDGYDTILLSPEDEILRKFYQSGKDLLFSTETACWPDKNLTHLYPVTSSVYRYLNSGGFIGKAGVIKKFLQDDMYLDTHFEKSNQYLWTKRFFKNPHIIGLDSSCEIFQTFSPEIGERYWPAELSHNTIPYYSCMKKWFMSNFTMENGRLFSKISGTWPCQAHFNGPSKFLMDHDITNMVFDGITGSRPARFIEHEMSTPIAK